MAIVVPIIADTTGFVRGITKSQSSLARFGKIAGLVAGTAALGGLVKTIDIGIEEFRKSQRVTAQTAAVLKSMGNAANVTATDVSNLALKLEKKSMLDDEAIQSGQNLILTFKNIRNEVGKGNAIFDRTTQAMVDVSTAMGIDASTAAIQLGKAINDPVRGVGQLRRVGVSFTESQRDQIKALVESGKTMTAQKMILGELEKQFGGSAAAAAKTLDGQLAILRNTFNNIAGDLVAKFMPSVLNAAQRLVNFLTEFSQKPTLEAKISLIVGTIKDAGGRVYRDLISWWTTTKVSFEDNPANRLKVTISLSGRQQFDAFFKTLEADARAAGNRMGVAAIRALAGVFTSEGRSKLSAAAQSFSDAFGGAAQFWFRVTGTTVIQEFIAGLLSAIPTIASRIGPALRDTLVNAVSDATKALPTPIRKAVESAFTAAGRKGSPALKQAFAVIISDPIKDAIASARDSLAGLGSSVSDMLSRITGATSEDAKKAAAIRKQQKEERAAREKSALEAALLAAETDDDRRKAQQDLDDFLLEQEAQRLEESVENQQRSNSLAIDNLIEEFNRGSVGLETFSTRLNEIIGADRGTELGIAFSGGFSRAISALTNEVASIVAGVAGTQAPAGTGVAAAQSDLQQKENEYQAALTTYTNRRAARLRQAEAARQRPESRSGSRIDPGERAEIHRIMAEWDRENKRPTRSAFGLAMGGILKKQVFTAGEAGAEAVIPLNSTSAMNMLRDAVGGGQGGSTTVYNLTVNAGLGTDPDELGRTIVESIKRFEKRNGQAFSAPLLSVTQNIAGQTSTGSTKTDFNRVTTLRKG